MDRKRGRIAEATTKSNIPPLPSGEREGPARTCVWEGEGTVCPKRVPSPFRRLRLLPPSPPRGEGKSLNT